MEIKRTWEAYQPSQKLIDQANQKSPYIRRAAAEVASRELGRDLTPDALPRVTFVDNERTRASLAVRSGDLQPWETPMVLLTRKEPLSVIKEIELHPITIAKRLGDVLSGDEDKRVLGDYMERFGLSEAQARFDIADTAAVGILIEATLSTQPIDPHQPPYFEEIVTRIEQEWSLESSRRKRE